MIEQWLLDVNNCEQWLLTTVVDRVRHNIVEQCAAQHFNKLLTTLIKLFIFAPVPDNNVSIFRAYNIEIQIKANVYIKLKMLISCSNASATQTILNPNGSDIIS